jgi:hypothetical protein
VTRVLRRSDFAEYLPSWADCQESSFPRLCVGRKADGGAEAPTLQLPALDLQQAVVFGEAFGPGDGSDFDLPGA